MLRFCLKFPSALLIILWDFSVYAHLIFIRTFAATNYAKVNSLTHDIVFDIGYCLLFILFPFFGLLADIKTGRYASIVTGVYLSFISWIIAGLVVIMKTLLQCNVLFWIISAVAYLLQVIGYSCVRSNIIQFNVDQAVGASGDELSAIIYWHSLNCAMYLIIIIMSCLINQFMLVSYVLSGIAVSIVIITNLLFKHWLEPTSLIVNPIKLIAKVLNYARKNKYPRNRSAFTYWEETYPSRLDLGKEKYGGPFTEEQVENVKVVLQLSPLFICITGLTSADEINWISKLEKEFSFFDCFIFKNALHVLVASLLILFYQLIVYPCFHNYIPSMLKRIGVGLVFALLTTIYSVIMLACRDHFLVDTTSYKASIISQVLYGIAFAFIYPTSLEFTIAQSPHEMRGFMVGLWYAAEGVGYAITINSKYLFGCANNLGMTCHSLYYFIAKSVIILIILMVFIVLAKRYNLRVRENEVNIHLIADEHYQRYLEQEIEYKRERGHSLD